MKLLLTLAAVLAMLLAFLWKSTLLPYATLLLLACLVMWGREVGFARRRSWGLLTAILLPVVLISLCMIFGETTQPMITVLAGAFDEYFSGFFFGITRMTEELSKAGFTNRLISIKGYAVLLFILCTLAAWKALCELSAWENMSLEKVTKNRDKPLLGSTLGVLLLLAMLLFSVMALDAYSPSCRSRCSGIQYRNFPLFQVLTLNFSLIYFFVGLYINTLISRLGVIPTWFGKASVD